MKLSEFKNEAALELLANIIEPAGDIMADPLVGKAYAESKIKAVAVAIKNHKDAVIKILAALDGKPVEEYSCNVFTIPIKLLEILNDPELAQLFTSQGQTGDAISSGSALANTEE